MKRYFSLMIIMVLGLFSISTAQENVKRETGAFQTISEKGEIRLELYAADREYMEIPGDQSNAENVKTELKDGILEIELDNKPENSRKIKIRLYYSNIEEINASSRCLVVSADTIESTELKLEARSGAKMELKIRTENLDASATQGGLLVLYGKTTQQEVSVASGASYAAFGLESDECYISVATGGNAKIMASKKLDARATAKGYISYKGDPDRVLKDAKLGGEIVNAR